MVDGMAQELSQAAVDSIEKNALANAARHGGKAEVGAVISKILGEFPDLRTRAADVAKEARKTVDRVNSMAQPQQLSLLSSKYPDALETKEREGRVGLPPLPNAKKGEVSLRLPPEPSGFMTIGHAMAFTINDQYKQMYGGELWLRFEDTNPKKALPEYYDSFRRGVAWLGIKPDHEKCISEDNELTYGHAVTLLESGEAYACNCDEAKVKKLRFDGTPCEHRAQQPEANLRVWQEMLARKHREGSYVIRLKGDMSSLDYSLRDPNIFRIIEHEHPVTGTRYVVWPTYNFANTVQDQVCGITHILRSSEFSNSLQDMIREKLSFRKPEVVQFSRFNFKGTPVHKRLLRPLVEKGLVSGWDDPRMPTVDGVMRRGVIPEAVRQFTLQVGYTKSEHEYDWSLLLSVNKKLLDPASKRLFFVPDPVSLKVEGAPARSVTIRFHPETDLGERTIETAGEFLVPGADLRAMQEGTVFRLMDLYNVKVGADGTAAYAGDELIRETRKVQWVTPGSPEMKVVVPGPLFDDKGEFNAKSLVETHGLGEGAFLGLKEGEIVQLPRVGFCRLDSPGTLILCSA